MENNNLEIDYKFCHFTDRVAFVIRAWSESGKLYSYTSPFVFSSCEDAYDAAIIELARK